MLYAHKAGGDDDTKMYSSQIVNNKSFNMSPFNTLRITCQSDFNSGGSWVSYNCVVTVLNTSKSTIKTMTGYVPEAGPIDDIVSFDISDIDQQAFITIRFESAGKATGSGAWIYKIELLN